ncbi:MAG: YvcK family protein [Parasporobacterium sp.]|nr:YvcK family protein [Parasporobacterium sp.]
MKKVIVFGGGAGLSCLLSGLKLFPLEVTTVIAVSDNGSSTGVLKEEFGIPAVGDVGKVLLSMANVDEDFVKLLSYRFQNEGSTLYNHPVRNILMTALIDLKGNLTEATRYMCALLNIKGSVLPLTEERADLVGHSESGGEDYYGQVVVSQNIKNISTLSYDHDITVGNEVKKGIADADLIIFSPGSLYTSILPHLIVDDIVKEIERSKAPIMYVSNLVTQPGETDGYSVSDHIKVLNKHLGSRKVDVVVANNGHIDPQVVEKYLLTENKTMVDLDRNNVSVQGAQIIEDDIFCIEDGRIRHKALNTAFRIFSFLMEEEEE